MARLQTRYIIAFGAGVLLAATFFDVLHEDGRCVARRGSCCFLSAGKGRQLHASGEEECEAHRIGPGTVIGMALDNVIDGIETTVSYLIDPLMGFVVTLAVVLHEIPQGIASVIIARDANGPSCRTIAVLGLADALYPKGALVAGWIPQSCLHPALAFVARDFLYIGASDLLPEAHRRFNATVILSVLVGMGFVLLLRAVFSSV